jgi:hypothetical protein
VSDHPLARAVRLFVLERGVPECGIAFWDGERLVPQYARREPRSRQLERAFELFERVVVVGSPDHVARFRERFGQLAREIEERPLATTSISRLFERYPSFPARARPLPERGQRFAILSFWRLSESPHVSFHELDRRVESFAIDDVIEAVDGILVAIDQRDGPVETTEAALRPFVILPIRAVRPRLQEFVVLGDNGAVEAIDRPEPSITPRELAYIYAVMGVDLAFALDHIPHPSHPLEERLRRVALSKELTDAFLREARAYSYRSLAVAHGSVLPEITHTLRELLTSGIRDVAIPLGRIKSERQILSFMATNRELLRRFDWIHLLGIRPRRLARLGITDAYDSFDTTAPVRCAIQYEQLLIGEYDGTSVYVPPIEDEVLQRRVLDALAAYERRELDLDSVIDVVIRYWLMAQLERGARQLCDEERLRCTLESRFWETCECAACKTAGIAVVLHRSPRHGYARTIHNLANEFMHLRERPNRRPAQLYLI